MSKQNIIYIIFLSIFLLTISQAIAYDNSSLKLYFTMGDGISDTIYDTKSGIILTGTSNFSSGTSCKQGNCLQAGLSGTTADNNNLNFTYNNSDLTINYWFKSIAQNNDIANFALGIESGYPTPNTHFSIRTSGTNNISHMYIKRFAQSTYYYINGSINTHDITNMNMFTFVFTKNDSKVKGYINGVNYGVVTISAVDLNTESDIFEMYFIPNSTFDEVSLFTQALNSTDIAYLYNSSYGQNYYTTSGATSTPQNNTVPTQNLSINITNTTFIIGQNIYSKQQCVDIGDGLDYVCNDTFYNPFDNGFYCDIDSLSACGVGNACFQNIYDNDTNELFITNYNKECTVLVEEFPSIDLSCIEKTLDSTGWKLISPLYAYLEGEFGYSCNVLNYYPVITDTYCTDSSINDITFPRENDTLYFEGQCNELETCNNACTLNTYQCGGLKTSLKCIVQANGCTDWNTSTTCQGSDLCKSSSGLCSPLITNNTGTNIGTDNNPYNLTKTTQYIIVLLGILLVFGLMVFVGFITNTVKGSTIFGMILGAFVLIIATVAGWVSPVFLIILIILGVVGAILIGKSSGNEGG